MPILALAENRCHPQPMRSTGMVVVLVSFLALQARAVPGSSDSTIYNPDPTHLWNRLNATLFQRTASDGKKYGLDELDILYWYGTRNLVRGPSHLEAIAVMDEFIKSHGEKLIRDPLKRALLQRDLWELFDWSVKDRLSDDELPACRDLQLRLSTLIRRLALTTNEIASLPDNYALAEKMHLPDLPDGMAQTNGDWVCVGLNGGAYMEAVAPEHVSGFDGHSGFSVMLHVPGGGKADTD